MWYKYGTLVHWASYHWITCKAGAARCNPVPKLHSGNRPLPFSMKCRREAGPGRDCHQWWPNGIWLRPSNTSVQLLQWYAFHSSSPTPYPQHQNFANCLWTFLLLHGKPTNHIHSVHWLALSWRCSKLLYCHRLEAKPSCNNSCNHRCRRLIFMDLDGFGLWLWGSGHRQEPTLASWKWKGLRHQNVFCQLQGRCCTNGPTMDIIRQTSMSKWIYLR